MMSQSTKRRFGVAVRILVAGGGGFIGGHLVARLLNESHEVRSIDIKPLDRWHQVDPDAENIVGDCMDAATCLKAASDTDQIYNLAADMGGMGFIAKNKTACMLSVLINTQILMAAKEKSTARVFFASSACVYPGSRQGSPDSAPLKESDAYPADPEDGYGWEKLFSERLGRHFMEDYGLNFRTARYHNVYGPAGTWAGGREKAPAAACRKIAEAKISGNHEVEVWGDGAQTRSFMYVDDCVEGSVRLMNSDVNVPLNLGSSEQITVDGLYDLIAQIAGIRIVKRYNVAAPQGVRGRNSDNTLATEYLGWEPSTTLSQGLEATYSWVFDQLHSARSDGMG